MALRPPRHNAAAFARELKHFGAVTVGEELRDYVREIANVLTRKAIKYTPVKWGAARGAWRVTRQRRSRLRRERRDPTGSKAIAQLNLTLRSLQIGDDVWLVNNQRYILFIEFGGYNTPEYRRTIATDPVSAPPGYEHSTIAGWSTKLPQPGIGMLRLALREVLRMFPDLRLTGDVRGAG